VLKNPNWFYFLYRLQFQKRRGFVPSRETSVSQYFRAFFSNAVASFFKKHGSFGVTPPFERRNSDPVFKNICRRIVENLREN